MEACRRAMRLAKRELAKSSSASSSSPPSLGATQVGRSSVCMLLPRRIAVERVAAQQPQRHRVPDHCISRAAAAATDQCSGHVCAAALTARQTTRYLQQW